ncbi:XRE family transcriptional regulator [Treponema primitia]|uniref:XRE family transcriptional regulator n=1 Tax=Treponema primitia TaxID=88058 RepID=UPI00397F5EE1
MKYKSAIFKHIHQDATDMYKAGAITAEEMRRYDASCLVSPADNSRARATNQPALSASPGTQSRSIK